MISKPAPAFEGTAVLNGEFKQIKLSDFKELAMLLTMMPISRVSDPVPDPKKMRIRNPAYYFSILVVQFKHLSDSSLVAFSLITIFRDKCID